jgi:branched-chain amino acid transport system ATP-binding protein
MLTIDNLSVSYEGLKVVLRDFSLQVNPGELVAVIGSNGVGKSTLLRTVSGILRPLTGKVAFKDEEIQGLQPHQIVRRGIAHVPEGRQIFPNLTVLENLMVGATTAKREKLPQTLEQIFILFPKLNDRRQQSGGTLSGGEQQMLAIGRGLMINPELLLLDEPSMGLAPILVDNLFHLIRQINKRGTTILLVEQNARMALEIADTGFIIETGRIVMRDRAETLLHSDEVRKIYLGERTIS